MSQKTMKIHIAQMIVERDLTRNLEKILRVLEGVRTAEWVVFPEAALSGYFPEDLNYIAQLNPDQIDRAVSSIHDIVRSRGCNCLVGTARRIDGVWQNAGLLLTPYGPGETYAKIQLSALDRQHFRPGLILPVFNIDGVRVGIQLCRDLLFPQQWAALRQAGAKIVIHLNNAIKPHDAIWEHVLVARALEHAMYVCSVNNAAPPQQLSSYLIAPNGNIVLKSDSQVEQVLGATVDLAQVVQNVSERVDF